VPRGCCLNPPEGKSVAAGTHHPGTEVGEAVAKALEHVVPERSCPQVYKMGMPTVIFGTNPRDGKMFIDHSVDTFAAYCGAVKGQDGWGGMNVSFGNLIRATAEINESIFPIRQLWRDYETDSGGAGEYRGNCGSLYRKQVLAPATIYTYVVGKRYPMPGIADGRPGSPNRLIARAGGAHAFEVGDKAGYIEHAAGEWYEYHYGGGGGWGDALAPPPEKVLEDVLDEYVSVECARRGYGVVLTSTHEDLTLAVGRAPSEALRAALRAGGAARRLPPPSDGRGQRRRAPEAHADPSPGDPAGHAGEARPRPVGAGLLRRVRRTAEEAGGSEGHRGVTSSGLVARRVRCQYCSQHHGHNDRRPGPQE